MTDCHDETLLQAWLDRELSPAASDAVRSHLAVCAECAARAREAREVLSLIGAACQSRSEQPVPTARLRARVADGLAAPLPAGHVLFSRWGIAAAAAVLVVGIVGLFPERKQPEPPVSTETARRTDPIRSVPGAVNPPRPEPASGAGRSAPPPQEPARSSVASATDDAPGSARRATWLEAQTSRHLEQTQLLLRSIRNTQAVSASELHYERALSRDLLSRNRLLRRRAEQKEDAAAEEVLVQVEPLLLDIANLPDHAASREIASLQSLIRTPGILAELRLYASMNGS
jgi:hypothetical protein